MKKNGFRHIIPQWFLIFAFILGLYSCTSFYRRITSGKTIRNGHSSICRFYKFEKRLDSLFIEDIIDYGKVLDIQKFDSVLSIGAGSGSREYIYAMNLDSITFYLEDLDTSCCSQEKINNTYLPYYASQGITFTSVFKTVSGTETTVNLPDESVNKVLIYKVYHHFNKDKEMMSEAYRVLIPSGKLIIGEHVLKGNKKIRKSFRFCGYGGYYKNEFNFVKDIESVGFVCDTIIRSGEWRDFFFIKK